MVAGSAYAAKYTGGPHLSGNVGYGFGFETYDPGSPGAETTDGLTGSVESNFVITGGNDVLDYRIRTRFRGRDRQEERGDTNSFADGEFQTVRGHIRWKINDTTTLRFTKPAVSSVHTITEVDPVQNYGYGYNGELWDQMVADLQIKAGGGTFGIMVSPETPSAMTTTGLRGGRSGESNNMTLQPYAKLKFGGIGVNAIFTSASGDANPDAGDAADDGKNDFSGSATGFMVQATLPIGGGKLNAEVQSLSSDLDVRVEGAGNDSQDFTYTAVAYTSGGLNAAYAISTTTIGSGPDAEQTNLSVHYQMPAGKSGWVGPQLQMQTNNSGAPGADDVTQTAVRWVMNVKF
jgi:hypothetical protein